MKKLSGGLIIFTAILLLTYGCKKADSTFKQYVVPDGIVYVGKAKNAFAQSGNKRVRLVWLKGADPNVTKATVYWNNKAQSISVPYPASGDSVSVTINNLEETSYTFIIVTYNNKGDSSVPAEISTKIYGDNYQAGITNRSIVSARLASSGDKVTINWDAANTIGGAYVTELRYLNADGVATIQKIPVTEATSVINGIKSGTTFDYRTIYRPDSVSLDNFYTTYKLVDNIGLEKTGWSVVDYSSQVTAGENAAANIIDGNYHTRWHSAANTYPNFVTVDMKNQRTFTQLGVQRTDKDVPAGDDRGPNIFQVLISTDNLQWTDLGTYNFNRFLNGEQIFTLSTRGMGRYFKFIGLSGASPYMVLGEISAYGF